MGRKSATSTHRVNRRNLRIPNSAPGDTVLVFYSPEGELLHGVAWSGPDEEIAHGIVVRGSYLYLAGGIKYADQPQNDALSGAFPP